MEDSSLFCPQHSKKARGEVQQDLEVKIFHCTVSCDVYSSSRNAIIKMCFTCVIGNETSVHRLRVDNEKGKGETGMVIQFEHLYWLAPH